MFRRTDELFIMDCIREAKLNILSKAALMAYGSSDIEYLDDISSIFLFKMDEIHHMFNSLNSVHDKEISKVKEDFVYSVVDRAKRSVFSVIGISTTEKNVSIKVLEWEQLNIKKFNNHINFKEWLPELYLSLHKILSAK